MADTPDPAASALDRISAELRTFGASDEDTHRLIKAVEAALKLADNWSVPSPGAGPLGRALEAALQECASMIREAVARELAGKGESDA